MLEQWHQNLSFNFQPVQYDYLYFSDNPSCSRNSCQQLSSRKQRNHTATSHLVITHTLKTPRITVSHGNDPHGLTTYSFQLLHTLKKWITWLVQSSISTEGATNTSSRKGTYWILSNPRSTWSVGDSGTLLMKAQVNLKHWSRIDWYWREEQGGWDTVGH